MKFRAYYTNNAYADFDTHAEARKSAKPGEIKKVKKLNQATHEKPLEPKAEITRAFLRDGDKGTFEYHGSVTGRFPAR